MTFVAITAAMLTTSMGVAADPQATASGYATAQVIPFMQDFPDLRRELAKQNSAREGWDEYTEDWKGWSPEDAASHPNSYAHAEYVWSVQKDKSFRSAHMSSPIADKLRAFQDSSHGAIAEFFITDARGGNVVQTQPTSDWFQGDEAKFKKVANKKDLFCGEPQRDDTVGTTGVHVSIPIWSEEDTFLGVAVVLIVVDEVN
ncbi:MAG: PDC sensor domain-containing protein [Phycisphaerales bacterium]|nr:PDC sensor domain-containing protein [Phycisphaerales bacterium]